MARTARPCLAMKSKAVSCEKWGRGTAPGVLLDATVLRVYGHTCVQVGAHFSRSKPGTVLQPKPTHVCMDVSVPMTAQASL